VPFYIDRRTLDGANQSRVNTADAHRWQAEVPARGEYSCIDLAVEYHRRNLERVLVGNPSALYELSGQVQCRGELRRLGAATVYQYDPNSNLMQDRDLLDQFTGRIPAGKNFAAGFQYEDFLFELAYIGRCMFQRRYDYVPVFGMSHD
jgi:hypothetical protein